MKRTRPGWKAFFAALALASLSGCGWKAPGVAKRNLWTGVSPLEVPEVHLVLLWKAGADPQADAAPFKRDLLVSELSKGLLERKLATVRSHQISSRPENLAAFIPFWRPRLPVLWVNAAPKVEQSSSSAAVSLELSARFQPLLFDTSQDMKSAKASLTAAWSGDSADSREAKLRWFDDNQPALMRSAAKALLDKLGRLQPSEGVLRYHPGEGPLMEQAFSAAQGGDWKKAASLWEERSQARPDDEKAWANLSVAQEMLGDLDKALESEKRRAQARPKSWFSELVRLAEGADRAEMLSGLSRLQQESSPALSALGPGTLVAVLPLENATTDLQADAQVRRRLIEAVQAAGYSVAPIEEVDERLRRAGFTDGGQLKALSSPKLAEIAGADYLVGGSVEEFRVVPLGVYFRWEVRAKLRLVYGPKDSVVHEDEVEVLREEVPSKDKRAGRLAVELIGLLWKKNRGEVLVSESTELAARFVRPWPHFVP